MPRLAPTRAPSRTANAIAVWWSIAAPYSSRPARRIRKTGTIRASSTIAWPRRTAPQARQSDYQAAGHCFGSIRSVAPSESIQVRPDPTGVMPEYR